MCDSFSLYGFDVFLSQDDDINDNKYAHAVTTD
jgi:hypothetical protein